jgi:hypothetical protein
MSVLGWFLAFAGFVGLIVGLLQMLKGKKMNSVPFRAPAQIAQLGPGAADAKGLVSTEGAVGQQGIMIAPMSGKPCLGYEITINRKWEKSEMTENGAQTKKGSDKVFSDYKGAIFPLQDGAGTVFVDATEQPDVSMTKAHSSEMTVGLLGIPSTLQFGGFTMGTPSTIMSEGRTLGFEGVEKIIEPSGTLYALGAVAMGPQGPVLHTPKGIGTGKLILSPKGRASLVGSTKRNMILGYAIGGVLFVGGTLLGIFGPAPEPSASNSCTSHIAADTVSCDARLYTSAGDDYTWTVPAKAEYTISLRQPKVKFPIDGTLTVFDAKGDQVAYNDGGSPGAEAKIKQTFEPGTYKINARDFSNNKVKGGFGYHLEIAKTEEPAVGSATITNADLAPSATATAAKGAPAAAKLTIHSSSKGIAPAKPAAHPAAKTTAEPAAKAPAAPAAKPAAEPATKAAAPAAPAKK